MPVSLGDVNLPQNPGAGPHRTFLGLLVRQLQQILNRISEALSNVGTGSGNVVNGTLGLSVSPATFTDLVNASVTTSSSIALTPTDLYGAAEVGAGNLYATPLAGKVRIFHTASTKTRSFSYVLSLALLLFAHGALGQQLYCGGTPQEVRPKLNLIGGSCVQDSPLADANNVTLGGSGDMLKSDYAIGLYSGTNPNNIVDTAEAAFCLDLDGDGQCEVYTPGFGAIYFDGDENGFPEVQISPGLSAAWDTSNDGAAEFSVTANTIQFYQSPRQITIDNSVTPQTMVGANLKVRIGAGVSIGNGTTASVANSAGIGREATTDRLFLDLDNDFGTTNTREVIAQTPPLASQEHYLDNDNEQLRLASDYTNATTTGTEITGLTVAVNGLRTYDVTWHLFVKSAAAGTGAAFGFDYSNGTPSPLKCTRRFPSTGVGAGVTGVEDDAAIGGGAGTGNTGQVFEYFTTSAESSTAPDMGPTVGFANASPAYVLEEIQCLFVTATGAGNIRLYGSAENANTITVMAGSWVNVVTVQ